MNLRMALHGIIFDLDGTLIDSQLDFDQMRSDMDLPPGQPILEALAAVPPGEILNKKLRILREHEFRGADLATLMPGVRERKEDSGRRSGHGRGGRCVAC